MKHEETKQVQTLRDQFRFIKYGVGKKKCHFCDHISYQVTLEYIDFEGNVLIKDCHDRATKELGHEYTLTSLNHENEEHHDLFVEDVRRYKEELRKKRMMRDKK